MTTITVWLLVAVASSWSNTQPKTTNVVERFASVEECERVRKIIGETVSHGSAPPMRCIQATVVKP